ncbi:MAG: glycosyltransferase family 2 protein [Desulfatibacillaceae bacterium]
MQRKTLVVQIPCKDEAGNLEATLADIPRDLPGVDRVEVLVVDDGSVDGTAEKAVELGVEHVLRFSTNRGLARTFESGLQFAAHGLGADYVVNTDGDNQYQGAGIADLVREIRATDAGMVVGRRDYDTSPHFSEFKRAAIRLGSRALGVVAGYPVEDAPSGFRCFTGQAARRLTVLSRFTYTMETLVQARVKGVRVRFIPVSTNPPSRGSRLMDSSWHYLWRTMVSLVAIVALYEPLWLFAGCAAAGLGGLLLAGLFTGTGWFFSLISVLLVINGGFTALVGKMLVTNRIHVEERLLWLAPDLTPEQWARRLGASVYYRYGEMRFSR